MFQKDALICEKKSPFKIQILKSHQKEVKNELRKLTFFVHYTFETRCWVLKKNSCINCLGLHINSALAKKFSAKNRIKNRTR